jgi:hypothetical protein
MSTNRIASSLSAVNTKRAPRQSGARAAKTLSPPANFVPVPAEMLACFPAGLLAWQEQLYRMAYQAALASVHAARCERARWN